MGCPGRKDLSGHKHLYGGTRAKGSWGSVLPPMTLLPEGLYGYQHLLSKPFSGSPAEHLSLWVLR